VLAGGAAPELSAGAKGLLTAEYSAPRELAEGEIGALLAAAAGQARLAALLLLNGLSTEEIASLRSDQVDLAKRQIRLDGGSPRTLAMLDATLAMLAGQSAAAGTRLLGHTPEELAADLLCAAYDAGIERPTEVTLEAIRHTYIAFLARQGIRLADLAKIVGRLPAGQVTLYSEYAPAGKRLGLDEVKRVIQGFEASGTGQA
jgi:integrase